MITTVCTSIELLEEIERCSNAVFWFGESPTSATTVITSIPCIIRIVNDDNNYRLGYDHISGNYATVPNAEFISRCKELFPKRKVVEVTVQVEVPEGAKYVMVDKYGEIKLSTCKPRSKGVTSWFREEPNPPKCRVINWKDTLKEV